jgi:putative transferase (TIGR04331 family)
VQIKNFYEWNHDWTMSALRASQELVPTGLKTVRELLCLLTGVNYSDEFIRIVHGFWVQHLCNHVVYASLSDTSKVAAREMHFVVPLYKTTYPAIGSGGTSQVEMASRLLVGDGGQNVELSCEGESIQPTPKLRRLKSNLTSALSSKDAKVWVSNPYLPTSFVSQVRVARSSRQLIRWDDVDPVVVQPGMCNYQTRKLAYSAVDGTSLQDVVRALVPLTIPIALAEALPFIKTQIRAQKIKFAQLIYTANAHHYNIGFKVAVAQMVESGAHLLIHQHGGGYGIDELHPGELFDRSISHRFFTFGWVDDGTEGMTKPLPTAPRGELREKGSHYLLIAAEYATEFFRFQSFCMPAHAESCVTEATRFLSLIDESHVVHLRSAPALPFPIERLKALMCTVKAAPSNESGVQLASRAALVVHNYLGTSWLETLAMNIPTVCFYDPNLYQPRAAAQPFVDALARVGIIHYSGREAARFVNSLRGDPSAWWKSAEVQEAREAFVARYANFSDDWLDAWQDEFESLLAG